LPIFSTHAVVTLIDLAPADKGEFMRYFDRLAAGSQDHKANLKGKTLQISAVNSELDSLQAFQNVATEALQRAAEEGYTVLNEHITSMYSGDLYDQIIFQRDDDG
jgi:hypothetical protein